ncbi:MAG: DUF2461 domain-containing protein [Acidobacteriota bacterium]|nr:DUF2461 domain-containing protein [Acidobacteriota bacterium]
MAKIQAVRSRIPKGAGTAAVGSFPEEGFRFLAQLKKHNDREWFNPRKSEYKRLVDQPMSELVHAVSEECRRCGLPLHAKDKAPVMRVYRDVRFSNDKSPYKTHVAAELRRSFSDSNVVLYLHFSPAESLLGAGVWQPERSLLQAWREAIASNLDRFAAMVAGWEAGSLALTEEYSLASMPRGFQAHSGKPFARWLKLTSFLAIRRLTRHECTSPQLLETIVDFADAAKPLFEFGWELERTSAQRR